MSGAVYVDMPTRIHAALYKTVCGWSATIFVVLRHNPL